MCTADLQSLPVEIIHRILDSLDADTVFLSLRLLCRRFHAIIQMYNRVQLDFRSFSKINFQRICRLVRFENVTTVVLSDDDRTPGQIELFLSLVDLRRLTRLQSLTLHSVDELSLNTFLNHTSILSLTSLSIKQRARTEYNVMTTKLLSSTIAKLSHLQRLRLAVQYDFVDSTLWLQNASIRSLLLGQCTPRQLIVILRDLPQLYTLVLHNVHGGHSAHLFDMPSRFASSLKSLTIEQKYMSMSTLRALLSLTPLLVYLQVTGWTYEDHRLYDGAQWERYIQASLVHLVKFEFFFSFCVTQRQTVTDLESMLTPFRTAFWREAHGLHVACDYTSDLNLFKCYSIPVCESTFEYEYNLNRISRSTLPTATIADSPPIMNNVDTLKVDLLLNINGASSVKMIPGRSDEHSVPRLFNKVTKLSLWIVHHRSSDSMEHLSSLIDLSHIREIHLNMNLNQQSLRDGARFLTSLSKQASNVDTIDIPYPLCNDTTGQNMELICLLLSSRVRHLKAGVYNLREMQMILERSPHLSSVEFDSPSNLSDAYSELLQWLKQRGTQFIHVRLDRSLALWLNEKPPDS